jgi:plastocyanin
VTLAPLVWCLLSAGRIEGTVAYTGERPKAAKVPAGGAGCPARVPDSSVVVSKSGRALANVVVRVIAGAAGDEPTPIAPVVIDQRACVYQPRVQGAVRGQRLLLRNSDGTTHNVHAHSQADGRTLFNVVQPAGAKDVSRDATVTFGVVRLVCDVHPWMRAYVVFNENRFFAVSDENGRFEIALPGGRYTLEAWHETLGTQTAEVTVDEGAPVDPRFAFGPQR